MSLIDFSCLCIFIVFAQLTESRVVLILRDDDDGPIVLGHVHRSSDEDVRHKHQASSHKPKRFHAKKTVLQYGRHIYHLDNFKDLKELRTKMTQRKPDSISYDYFDMDDLYRVRDSAKNGVGDFIKDLVIFSNTPVQFCNGDRYDEDLRKFSKHKNDDDADWKLKKMQFGRMKRFQIVDNRHKSKPHDDASEEHHEKKKQKSTKKIKKRKKKKHSSESTESMSKESGSEEKSEGSHKKTKKKYKPPKEEKQSSEENIVKIKRKPKKKHHDDDSTDASDVKRKKHDIDSKSNEDFHKKKNKKKKISYEASDETTRKTFPVEDDFFMQGNRIFHAKEKRKKKHNDFVRRRRLENFLPKRYHWDPKDIHDLGYYWFNGPKGAYPAPRPLHFKK